MKAVKIELAGRIRYLCFTVEAMFQIEEQFDGPGALTDALRDSGREGFSAACKAAAILAEQGELVRRSLGYDPEPMVDEAAIAALMAPSDIVALKLAILSAISLGFGREVVDEDDEVDLGLAELNAQKKNRDARAHYLSLGLRVGLSKKEALLSTPGEVGDLWELYLRAHGTRKKENPDGE